MHIEFRKCSIFRVGLLLWAPVSMGQTALSKPEETFPATDSLAQASTLPLPDSILRRRDSLEVVLLRTTQTYQHVEHLLASLPAQSPYLNLLPSVLPVDLPLSAFHVSSPFGYRLHPIHKQTRFHGGVDVKAPLGMIVKATAAGVVKQVGFDPTLGAFVRLQHAFGFETTYGHLEGYCVKPGQTVERNQELGRVGKTGLATGPHLHYVIKKNGSVVDPFDFCFLLRRRLWFYELKSKTKGASASVSEFSNCLSPRGE